MLDLLFVYGTLRRHARSPMHDLLRQQAEFVGEGSYQGLLYRVTHYPGAIPSHDPAHQVRGDLFRLKDLPQSLAQLDAYEEIGATPAHTDEYVREIAQVCLDDGTLVNAWVYRYNRTVSGLERIVSGDFLSLPGART
jgi:gamma-glutamylcyclotransferase (GGCT)/AIG2-like uncharacterized protein YtfP